VTADDRTRQQAASASANFTPYSVTETHTVLVSGVDDVATPAGPLIVTEASATYHRGEDGSRRVTARIGGTLRERYDAGESDTFGHLDYSEADPWPDWLAGLAWDCHPEPQRPPYAIPAAAPIPLSAAVLALLGPALAALLTTDDQRRAVLDIRDLIGGDDNITRAWLIGQNPHLDDESPLGAIADGRSEAAMIAARAFV
jgi:hypothetical protein